MNVIISIHLAGYRSRPFNSAKKRNYLFLQNERWFREYFWISGLQQERSLFCRAKWPLAAYSCFNCSHYLIYRYHMWAKGNAIDCQALHPLLFDCWSHLFSSSQAWNINEVPQMSGPAISSSPTISSKAALFSPFVTWNARSWTIRNHILSRNIAFPTRAGHAVPGCSIYHGMTGASLRSWEVCAFWSSHCGVQFQVWIQCYFK